MKGGGREGGKEGEREGGRKGEEGGREGEWEEGGREGGRERGREGGRERGREGGRERGREGGREKREGEEGGREGEWEEGGREESKGEKEVQLVVQTYSACTYYMQHLLGRECKAGSQYDASAWDNSPLAASNKSLMWSHATYYCYTTTLETTVELGHQSRNLFAI